MVGYQNAVLVFWDYNCNNAEINQEYKIQSSFVTTFTCSFSI